jgi:hypothetical protein
MVAVVDDALVEVRRDAVGDPELHDPAAGTPSRLVAHPAELTQVHRATVSARRRSPGPIFAGANRSGIEKRWSSPRT